MSAKAKALTTGLILCLAGLAIAAWLLFGGAGGSGLSYANADKYTAGDTEIASPIEELEVEWTEGFVHLEYYSGDRIRVSETSPRELSDDDKLRWWLDGTTLRIRYAKSGIRLFSANLEKTLTVSLPEGTVLKNAGIHATSADLNIRELSAEEIALDTSSGDISAAVTAKKLKASSTAGDMKISQEEDLDTATLDSTSGNIGASFGSAKEIAVTTTSGGAGVTVTGAADRVKAHSTSGNVYLDLAEAGTAEASSTSGSVSFKAGRIGTLKIDSTSGDVTACLPEDPGFRCEISTTSGDISSDLAVKQEGSVYTCGDESAKCRISTTSGDVRLAK